MSAFADSSALVKLYVPEVGHEAVRALPVPLVVSALARAEVPAALWGKSRTGEIEPEDAALLATAFAFDYHGDEQAGPRFLVVAVTEAILVDAARQASRHGLRAYDAVQLTSALAARNADPSIDTIAVYDKHLRLATLTEGFIVP